MKKFALIAAVLALASTHLSAQTPTPAPALNYAQARQVQATLPSPRVPADVVTAINVELAAPDITPAQRAYSLADKAIWLSRAGGSPSDVIALYQQAYQGGYAPAYLAYLKASVAAGDPLKSTAFASLPAFLSANAGTYYAAVAQATAQELQGQTISALQSWQAAANTISVYNQDRGDAIGNVARLSKLIGNTPAQTNALIVPMLTAYNVPVADNAFQKDYMLVTRSVMTPTDLKVFLTAILSAVNVTDVNAKFLGMVQSQLAAVSANN